MRGRGGGGGAFSLVSVVALGVVLCGVAVLGFYALSVLKDFQNELQELRRTKAFDDNKSQTIAQQFQAVQTTLNKIQTELQQAQAKAAKQAAQAKECPECPAPVVCKVMPSNQQSVAVREEKVKPLLRWMGIDGGTEFFKVFVLWDRLAKQTNGLIVEVGAGDGRQAAKAASQGWRVITVDANQNNLELGKKFLAEAKNVTGSVQWNWFAVSNYSGEAQFWGDVGMGRLLDGKKGDVTDPDNAKWKKDDQKTTTVQVRRLDDIVGDVEPFLLKIDVEGHELNVLRGATKLLAKKPKVIIIEWNPVMMEWAANADAYEVLKTLHDLGYDLYDTAISEPKKKGFLAKYPGFHRPTGFRELVDYFKKSKEFDWWGSWTDIVAVDPNYV